MDKIFSVSDYLQLVNVALADFEATVEGEVSNYRVSQNKWVSWDLIDQDGVLACFGMLFQLRQPLTDGMKIRVFGKPRVYAKNGRFSFWVESLELTGEGALRRAFEETKARLESEGLFDPTRKRALPRFPETVGLITSKDAAAYGDFIKVLMARFGGIKIQHANVQVQGLVAPMQIAEAFRYFNESCVPTPQVLVLTRGGGSLEDLQAFNSEEVVRAIFASKIPVICGVGHERDISLADLVADVRASTPSNAAELITPGREEIERRLTVMVNILEHTLNLTLTNNAHRLTHALNDLQTAFDIKEKISKVLELRSELTRQLENMLSTRLQSVTDYRRLLNSFDPKQVLNRGYALVRLNNQVITRAESLQPGDELTTIFKDGETRSIIKQKEIYGQRKK